MHASQVAALRRELLEWLHTVDAEAYYEMMSEDAGTWNQAGQQAALAEASLYFVSDEMTAVAAHASQSMPDQVPIRDEFPAESGFAVWDGSLVSADVVTELLAAHPGAEVISSCHVLSWKLMQLHPYADNELGEPEPNGETVEAAMLTFWVQPEGRTYPPLIPYHSAVLDLTLAIRASARADNEGGNEAAGTWIEHFDMAVYTTLVLMGQTVATVSTERPERAERRRTERAGLDVRDVRVVQLRRALTDNQPDETVDDQNNQPGDLDEGPNGKVAWRRRWVVRGHWRQQWYPSLNDHRSVWIHSYVKGPEDQPLLAGTDIVHALTR